MPIHRTHRPLFTQEQFEEQADQYWRMPSRLGHPRKDGAASILEIARGDGGAGALAALPQLGLVAGLELRHSWSRSREEMSRLGGCDQKSLRRGVAVLASLGLSTSERWVRHGQVGTRWRVSDDLNALPTDGDRWFRFSARVVYGGHWALASAAQKALYLALAVSAVRLESSPEKIWELRQAVPADIDRSDLNRCFEKHGCVRIARATYRDLRQVGGGSEAALQRAVTAFKHPEHWQSGRLSSIPLAHSPLAAYPTSGGALLFHFRDHLEPWGWEHINDMLGLNSRGPGLARPQAAARSLELWTAEAPVAQ